MHEEKVAKVTPRAQQRKVEELLDVLVPQSRFSMERLPEDVWGKIMAHGNYETTVTLSTACNSYGS